jgi:uncharacterized repeat protein (TIGR03803 family)
MDRIQLKPFSQHGPLKLWISEIGALILLVCSAVPSRAQSVSDLYSFNDSDSSQYPLATLVQGRDGRLYGSTTGLTDGSIFGLTTAGVFTELFVFDGSDGANPDAGLTLAVDGNFYGTSFTGGSAEYGVLFKITPSGTYTALHEFEGSADGELPSAPPIQASDGNLYGTTRGNFGVAATVYKYDLASKAFTTIYQFDGTHGQTVPAALIQGADGNLYGTAEGAGAYGCGTIFKMNRSGVILYYYSFPCATGGALPSAPLVQASDGNFYGTTFEGGDGQGQGNGTIFKMTQKGTVTILYSFKGGRDGSSPNASFVQATDGKLYGATAGGGSSGSGTLFRITTAGAYELLYSFPQDVGKGPEYSLMQHTNGLFYGTAEGGGANNYGAVYDLNMGLGPFVAFVIPSGGVGKSAQILGQGLTGTSSVTFNGVAATSFKVFTDTYMTAVVPSGATTGPVIVTTPAGTLKSNKNFRIIGGTASAARTKAVPPITHAAKQPN